MIRANPTCSAVLSAEARAARYKAMSPVEHECVGSWITAMAVFYYEHLLVRNTRHFRRPYNAAADWLIALVLSR